MDIENQIIILVNISGIDLTDLKDLADILQSDLDVARKFKIFYKMVRDYQDSFTSLEKVSIYIMELVTM